MNYELRMENGQLGGVYADLPLATRHPQLATRNLPPATRHSPPVTRNLPPATRRLLRINRRIRADEFLEERQDFAWFGVALLQSVFGIEQIAVDGELKRSFAAGDEGECFDHVLVMAQNLIRHTDGAFPVVSRHAIFKGDCVFFLHLLSPRIECGSSLQT
jgi:hypothetical protein